MLLFIYGCDNKNNHNDYIFETNITSNNNALPVVNIKLNNIKTKFIIDTGSEINIINSSYYYKYADLFEIIDSNFTELQTVNGTLYEESYIVKGYINDTIPIVFNVININNAIDNIFLNQQDYIDGIIGVDFLYKNKMIIDFNNKILTNSKITNDASI